MGDKGGKTGKGRQGAWIKDPGIKPKGAGLKVGVGGAGKMETTVLEQ